MYRFFEKAREPINSFTHFLGVLFAIIGASLLLGLSVGINFSPTTLASVLIFCLSMVLLYSASSWYHYSNGSAKVLARLRKLDHAMIYVLIAGSYTPICLKYMAGSKGIIFSLVLWAVAVHCVLPHYGLEHCFRLEELNSAPCGCCCSAAV